MAWVFAAIIMGLVVLLLVLLALAPLLLLLLLLAPVNNTPGASARRLRPFGLILFFEDGGLTSFVVLVLVDPALAMGKDSPSAKAADRAASVNSDGSLFDAVVFVSPVESLIIIQLNESLLKSK